MTEEDALNRAVLRALAGPSKKTWWEQMEADGAWHVCDAGCPDDCAIRGDYSIRLARKAGGISEEDLPHYLANWDRAHAEVVKVMHPDRVPYLKVRTAEWWRDHLRAIGTDC
jgi:hypothetical protein